MFYKSGIRWPITLLTLLLVVSLGMGSAYANNEKDISLENKIMSYDYAHDVITLNEQKYLTNNHELAAKRAEKDAKYLLNLTEKQMQEQMSENIVVYGVRLSVMHLNRQ